MSLAVATKVVAQPGSWRCQRQPVNFWGRGKNPLDGRPTSFELRVRQFLGLAEYGLNVVNFFSPSTLTRAFPVQV